MADAFAAMFAVAGLTLAFLWLVRTLLRHRERSRWVRLQSEMHTKIVDKLEGGEELLQYLSAGSGPTFGALPEESSHPRPLGRILGSLQLGTVLVLGGAALLVLRGQAEGPELLILGTLGVAIGAGFLLSGALSFYLSRAWGLIDPPSHHQA